VKIDESTIKVLNNIFLCNHCLGRLWGQLLSGLSNEERGRIIRLYIAFLIDSGEKIDIDSSNLYGIKLRNVKLVTKKPMECFICKNFFDRKINEVTKKIIKKLRTIEFNTFQIGTIVPSEMLKAEEKIWEFSNIEFVESIKSEINRELGKNIERLTKKKFAQKNPDVTAIVNLNTGKVRVEIRSLYILGGYQKLKRGIPQTKWMCKYCNGKGCKHCKGKGKLYPTSIQEIIEKPLLKVAKSKKSSFHGLGREDIDARCLDYRPFIIEIEKPIKRKIDLKSIEKQINKTGKVRVKGLRFTTKDTIRKIKFAKIDKTYLATVEFEKTIDKKKLKELKKIEKEPILQKTPLRVVHRRADKFRKRLVKKISWKTIGRRRLQLKITGESGLYIKELITGDESRTKPNVSELLENKVKKITLDVIKIHAKKLNL